MRDNEPIGFDEAFQNLVDSGHFSREAMDRRGFYLPELGHLALIYPLSSEAKAIPLIPVEDFESIQPAIGEAA